MNDKNDIEIFRNRENLFVYAEDFSGNLNSIIYNALNKKLYGLIQQNLESDAVNHATHIRYLKPLQQNGEAFGKFGDILIKLPIKVITDNENADGVCNYFTYTYYPVCSSKDKILWLDDDIYDQANGIPYVITCFKNDVFNNQTIIFLKVNEDDYVKLL